eukprot:EG_transcript_19093
MGSFCSVEPEPPKKEWRKRPRERSDRRRRSPKTDRLRESRYAVTSTTGQHSSNRLSSSPQNPEDDSPGVERTPVRPLHEETRDIEEPPVAVPAQPRQAFLDPDLPELDRQRRKPRGNYVQPETTMISPITAINPKPRVNFAQEQAANQEIGLASTMLPFAKRPTQRQEASFVQEKHQRFELPGMVD